MTGVEKAKPAIALAGAIALWAGTGGLATADSLGINFEASGGPPTGSIQGQQGWAGSTPPGVINPAIDQEVVIVEPRVQDYRRIGSYEISNAYTSGSFGD